MGWVCAWVMVARSRSWLVDSKCLLVDGKCWNLEWVNAMILRQKVERSLVRCSEVDVEGRSVMCLLSPAGKSTR